VTRARTSPTSTRATKALSTAGRTTAWVRSRGTARSGRSAATPPIYTRFVPVLRGQTRWGSVIRLHVDLIAGSLSEAPRPDGVLEDTSPADLGLSLGRHGWALAQVERAVQAARAAQPGFAARPTQERAQLVRRIGAVF